MKSCASKCERVGSGEPAASTIASCPLSQNGFNACSDGCSPKRPSRSIAPFGFPGGGTAMLGRSS